MEIQLDSVGRKAYQMQLDLTIKTNDLGGELVRAQQIKRSLIMQSMLKRTH